MRNRISTFLSALLLPALLMTGCGAADSSADFTSAAEASEAAGEASGEIAEEAVYDRKSDEALTADFELADGAEFSAAGEAVLNESVLPDATDGEDDTPPADADSTNDDTSLPPDEDPAQPFVLTAGEWNDNDNWGFFTNLIHSGLITFPSYGLQPCCRIAVTVTNSGTPVLNQTVQLVQEGGSTPVWTAKTDRNGKAYLFYPDQSDEEQSFVLKTDGADDITLTVAPRTDSGQGTGNAPILEYTMETGNTTQHYSKTEVMFILDTTGSMGDEITYLQRDFASIAGEVADGNTLFSVNFYKDEGDEYVTKCHGFSDDLTEIQHILNQEYADGGNDEPEAVAQILYETMVEENWSTDTNKIAFLIFDAPPHASDRDLELITEAIQTAAKRGIHLVPVVASNASRETELFGRAAAIMTNSNYIFLTDDSGVGDSHLEPIIGNYEVELLHDIIVRNIREIAGTEE